MADPTRTNPQLQAVIGRALVDADFRARLMADVRGTLAAEKIELDEETISAIESTAREPERVRSFTRAFDDAFVARADYAV
jgi:hypothetical protein